LVSETFKGEYKMNNNWQFWTTFILALIGALAWMPHILDFFKKSKIEGKTISRYNNINADKTETIFLFKLSIFSKNKSFNLKQISCEIEDLNGKIFLATARNNRLIVFTFEKPYKLLVPENQFLNNFSLLPADKNVVGYLCFHFAGNLDRKLRTTTFILESFNKRVQRLRFQESDVHKEQLLFDDTIWQTVDMEEIQNHPALRSK
jgi:hypothetical protein